MDNRFMKTVSVNTFNMDELVFGTPCHIRKSNKFCDDTEYIGILIGISKKALRFIAVELPFRHYEMERKQCDTCELIIRLDDIGDWEIDLAEFPETPDMINRLKKNMRLEGYDYES